MHALLPCLSFGDYTRFNEKVYPSEGPKAHLLGWVSFHPAVGCNAAKTIFVLIIWNHIIHNNSRSLRFFYFEGEVDVNDLKKVPGNMGRELKDKKHRVLLNNLPIDGENFYNNSIS